MPNTMENVKTVNSAVRTVLMLAIIGFLGYAGWYMYTNYIAPSQQAKQLKADFEKQAKELEFTKGENTRLSTENDRLSTANKLLKVTTRLANICLLYTSPSPRD